MKRAKRRPMVVLLHGLARRSGSMDKLAEALHEAGFETWAVDYPSITGDIEGCARDVGEQLRKEFPRRKLCAVTHSLGGIIFRHLGDFGLHWHRAVMLAPPNNGSAIARAVSAAPATAKVFRYLRGTALGGLAGPAGVNREWPFPPAPFAVIAGTRRFAAVNPTSWWSHRIFGRDEAHDGTVAVEETKLDGMAAFTTVDASHTTIMDDERVHRHVVAFLRDGYFKRTGTGSGDDSTRKTSSASLPGSSDTA